MAATPAAAQARVDVGDAQVTEGAAANATFVVTRKAPLLSPAITVNYGTESASAVAPGDYTAVSGSVRFASAVLGGTQVAHVRVPIVNDQLPEDIKRFRLRLSGPELGRTTGIGTILDDDPASPAGRLTGVTHLSNRQQLIARTPSGGAPNAPAFDPVISWDARTARYLAYVSTATDIRPGSGGHKNVYLVKRGGKAGKYGTPWKYGKTVVASRGLGGAPANGDSWSPALGGWSVGDVKRGPTCLAFVSNASNLVSGDANGQADVFMRKLPGGKLKRIASRPGEPATEANVAGDCSAVAMVAGTRLYVKRGGKRLRKVGGAGASRPDLTAHGNYISYTQNGMVYTRRVGGGARRVAPGINPTADGDRPGGRIGRVAYTRGASTYIKKAGSAERHIGSGVQPSMTAGGAQVMFGHGPFIYMYAVSNSFGKKLPKGYCPPGQGSVNNISTSARGNYIVFSCTGGNAYLSYIGEK